MRVLQQQFALWGLNLSQIHLFLFSLCPFSDTKGVFRGFFKSKKLFSPKESWRFSRQGAVGCTVPGGNILGDHFEGEFNFPRVFPRQK